MTRGRMWLAMWLVVAMGGWAACDDWITLPTREPTMEGVLVGVNGCELGEFCIAMVPESIETVWVKTDTAEVCGVVLTVTDKTDLVVREGSAVRRALPREFILLRPVRVWIEGDVVAESCPAQGGAEVIELQ